MDPRSSKDNTHSDDDSDSFNSSSARPIRGTQDKTREGLSSFVVANRLPFQLSKGIHFDVHMQRYTNRCLRKFSSDTRKSYCSKLFNEMRENLKLELSNYKGNISIACDLFTGSNYKCYICVTAHYIDSNWTMQKRIIAVRMLKNPSKTDHIFKYLMEIFNEFGVLNKIFSLAFDNVSGYDDVIEMLITSLEPPFDAKLFHVSHFFNIISSIARDGLALVETHVRNIRMALKFISSSQSRQKEFGEICESFNLKNRRFVDDDMNPRWNSTYLMLQSCKDYRDAITAFYHKKQSQYFLSDDDWNIAFTFMKFMLCFHVTIKYSSPHSIILHFYNISKSFSEYRNNESIAHICDTMEKKFLKYWEDIPILFALSIVMDPRIKLSALEYYLNQISKNLNTESKIKIDDVSSLSHEMYSNYATKYKNMNHRDFTYEGEDKFMLLLKEIHSLRSNSSTNELSTYLETNIAHEDLNLGVLNWWKLHEWKYPILSIMARDLLTLPVSTQASESDLRARNKILEDRRNLLTAEMFECMVCLKDWQNMELDAITYNNEYFEIEDDD